MAENCSFTEPVTFENLVRFVNNKKYKRTAQSFRINSQRLKVTREFNTGLAIETLQLSNFIFKKSYFRLRFGVNGVWNFQVPIYDSSSLDIFKFSPLINLSLVNVVNNSSINYLTVNDKLIYPKLDFIDYSGNIILTQHSRKEGQEAYSYKEIEFIKQNEGNPIFKVLCIALKHKNIYFGEANPGGILAALESYIVTNFDNITKEKLYIFILAIWPKFGDLMSKSSFFFLRRKDIARYFLQSIEFGKFIIKNRGMSDAWI